MNMLKIHERKPEIFSEIHERIKQQYEICRFVRLWLLLLRNSFLKQHCFLTDVWTVVWMLIPLRLLLFIISSVWFEFKSKCSDWNTHVDSDINKNAWSCKAAGNISTEGLWFIQTPEMSHVTPKKRIRLIQQDSSLLMPLWFFHSSGISAKMKSRKNWRVKVQT